MQISIFDFFALWHTYSTYEAYITMPSDKRFLMMTISNMQNNTSEQ